MKSTLLDWARKWGVGVCLLLWCWLTYVVMAVPAMLLLLLSLAGMPQHVLEILIGAYAIICVPLLAYQFGRAFGLRYDKVPTSGSSHDNVA
jgi:hypothetical protein